MGLCFMVCQIIFIHFTVLGNKIEKIVFLKKMDFSAGQVTDDNVHILLQVYIRILTISEIFCLFSKIANFENMNVKLHVILCSCSIANYMLNSYDYIGTL